MPSTGARGRRGRGRRGGGRGTGGGRGCEGTSGGARGDAAGRGRRPGGRYRRRAMAGTGAEPRGEARDADAVEKARAAAACAAAIAHEGEGVVEDEAATPRPASASRDAATRRSARAAGTRIGRCGRPLEPRPDEISAKGRHLSAAWANYDFSIITCPRNRQKRLVPLAAAPLDRRAVRSSTPSPRDSSGATYPLGRRRHRRPRARVSSRSEPPVDTGACGRSTTTGFSDLQRTST